MVAEGSETEEEARTAIEAASATFADDEEDEDWEERHDRVSWIFSLLPKIIPQIEEAYQNYDSVFSRRELGSMDIILSDYAEIRDPIEMELMELSTFQYGRDPKDPGKFVPWLPKRIKQGLNWSILHALAEGEVTAWRRKTAEAIMKDGGIGLSSLGITLSERFLTEEENEEPSKDASNSFPGRIISI